MKFTPDTTKDAVNISNVPLSREELAAYFKVILEETNRNNLSLAAEIAKQIVVQMSGNLPAVAGKKSPDNSGTFQIATLISEGFGNVATKYGELKTSYEEGNRNLVEAIRANTKALEENNKQSLAIAASRRKQMFSLFKDKSNSSFVINKENPHLVNSESVKEINDWITNAWKSCGLIGKRIGKTKKEMLIVIYDILRENFPIEDDYREYILTHPNASKISMCGHSDFYRKAFQDATYDVHKKYFPEKYTFESILKNSDKVGSATINKSPQNITDMISAYAKRHNITRNSATYRMYRELSSRTGIKVSKVKYDLANELGYKAISSGYYVTTDENLLNTFKAIAEE